LSKENGSKQDGTIKNHHNLIVPTAGNAVNDKLKGASQQGADKPKNEAPPAPYNTFTLISAQDLQKADIPPIRFIVAEILPQGLVLLTAPSKYGKSWFALDLCLSVAAGKSFLGFRTEQCGVLYIALEDSQRRLKARMHAILRDTPAPAGFDYTTTAPTLDTGLESLLREYITNHPNTGLIVVDVLQKVRSDTPTSNAYAADYADMTKFKRIADEFNIAVVILHHNRKMLDANDPFNMISGTMGLMGASDTAFVLHREKRKDEETTLSITGRDVEMNAYKIKWDKETARQRMIGGVEEVAALREEDVYRADPLVITIKALMSENPSGFNMTASDLRIRLFKYGGNMSENKLGVHLKEIVPNLLKYDDILYKKGRNRMHGFSYDTQGENPFLNEIADCENLTLDMIGDEATAEQDETV